MFFYTWVDQADAVFSIHTEGVDDAIAGTVQHAGLTRMRWNCIIAFPERPLHRHFSIPLFSCPEQYRRAAFTDITSLKSHPARCHMSSFFSLLFSIITGKRPYHIACFCVNHDTVLKKVLHKRHTQTRIPDNRPNRITRSRTEEPDATHKNHLHHRSCQ